MNRKIVISIAALVIVLVFIYISAFIVHQNELAIHTRFGRPIRVVAEPGLYFKLPFNIDRVYRLSSRLQSFESDVVQLMLKDKNPIIVTC
ncbi:MAG: SPFH domain-containing protein, partial [Candidatus Hydrogenedentota bacterium]